MGYWNSRGLRGSMLEELVNLTNEKYREQGLALIQKIPTSIKPIQLDPEDRHISLAYFEKKSTVDYIGAVQGIPICFDAKETTKESLPLQNIHTHQIEFMRDFEKQDGIAFLLVYFAKYDETFFFPFELLITHFEKAEGGGPKSIPYSLFPKEYIVSTKSGYYLHYLDAISLYLSKK